MIRFDRVLWCGALFTMLLTGCEPGTVTAPQGEVRGLVLVEGTSLSGVVVELTGPQTRSVSTDEAGRYSFAGVPSGAYVVTVRSVPVDASFPATSRTAVVSGSQTVTVDFLGNFIRTASIEGSVTSGSQGLAGVVVTLQGAQSGTTLTGAGGGFAFAGLRAGQYQVEISGFPESITFPSVRTDVTLSTGQSFSVTFEGVPELTASVVIRSIARRLPDGSTVLVDPQNARGAIEVTATVDRGQDTLTGLSLSLGGEVVGSQSFVPGMAVGSDASASPQPQAPLDIVFPIDTHAFDELSGLPRFMNGQVLLTAKLSTTEGGASAWVSSVQISLRNVNTFTGGVDPERGPMPGQTGEEWVGGDLEISVIPVLYDPSRTVDEVTVELSRVGGAQLRVKTQSGVAPFSVVLESAGVAAGSNVVGYQTPSGATDRMRVVRARYSDGANVAGVPVTLTDGLRIDNVGPAPVVFELPRQSAGRDCCLSNWVGAGFAFHDALTLSSDAGVGGVSATVHAGDANLTDSELAELPAVTLGGDLAPTPGNTELRGVSVGRDALGNPTVSALSPSDGNTLSSPLGGVFGVDLDPPQLEFDAAGVEDRSRNPAQGSAWVLSGTDALAGIAPMAARTSLRLLNPTVAGTPEQCLFPGAGDCDSAPDGLVRTVPGGLEGYLTFVSHVLDRAGNPSNTVQGRVVLDVTAPQVVSVQVPPTLLANAQSTFSAVTQDNLDLHEGWIALRFGSAGQGPESVPLQSPEVLGVPFDDDLTTSASLVQTFPLLIGLERVVEVGGTDAPSETVLALTGARGIATDAAGNLSTRTTIIQGGQGLPPRSFAVAERGDEGGVGDWVLEAASDRVCRSDAQGECAAGVPNSLRLVATARGSGGLLERPFDRVYFYAVRQGEPERIGVALGAQLEDGAGPLGRAWSWNLDWIPSSSLPPGQITMLAVGVDGDGNGLRTLDIGSVTLKVGP